MALRKVKDFSNEYVVKTIDVHRKIPIIRSVKEMDERVGEFSKLEALAMYQTLTEIEIWNKASWSERKILAPILDVQYNSFGAPEIIFPKFQPLRPETDSYKFKEEEAIVMLQFELGIRNCEDEKVGFFLEKLTAFSEKYGLTEDDILQNLNNIGYHKLFGVRVIDYGLTSIVADWYKNKVDLRKKI